MSSAHLDELHTIRDWIRYGSSLFERESLFFGHDTQNSWDEACFIVMWAIDQPWQRLTEVLDARLTSAEKIKVNDAYTMRVERRIPAAYITGEMQFAGIPFTVTEDVLVPRSPLAELIENGFQPWLREYPITILDMCTGSGCIGIATALAFPDALVDLADISEKAIDVAQRNIERHQLGARVTAHLSDGFAALEGKQYDLILSNPPYVSESEYGELPGEFKAEPKLGLSSGDDGLDFTRSFLSQASAHLKQGGLIVVEVGHTWPALEEAFPHVPFLWPEFENGGCGVFILTKEQLDETFKK